MSYAQPKDNPRAVRLHDEALANHQRAWEEMHAVGKECGYDSAEYAEARRAVVLLRGDVTQARKRVESSRTWKR